MRSTTTLAYGSRPFGRIRIGLVLGLAVVAIGLYVGSQAAIEYWAYWNLQEEAERAALEVAARDGQAGLGRQMVQAKAREYGLEFRDEDIQVTVQGGAVTIAFSWERPVQLPGYTYPLTFQVNVTTSQRVR